eukprot:CAMPEP_0195527406 /NCGR_PEP_ID=MMETSP0794_2-20130614/29054_1 /TAXON_ID=515487 /ORGANISM="Stephanopyxis turris, Strain CCMP 815" /LENGTH=604 /DNA_ID=CAMNT_0040658305 /DNA_START=125 /DNA_END=1939 /DNA_ORIENTATION=+
MVLDEWEYVFYDRYLVGKSSSFGEASIKGKRNLALTVDYQLVAGGICTDAKLSRYDFAFFVVGPVFSVELCALTCDMHPASDCKGFDVNRYGFCYLYFTEGTLPAYIPGSYFLLPFFNGEGDIFSSNGLSLQSSCFKRKTQEDISNTNHFIMENYDFAGEGYCKSVDDAFYSFLAYFLGEFGTINHCAEKCDVYPANVGFIWENDKHLCMCQFVQEDLPFDVNDPETLLSIPGACRFSGGTGSAVCEVDHGDGRAGYMCYRHSKGPSCQVPEPTQNPIATPTMTPTLFGGLFSGFNGGDFKGGPDFTGGGDLQGSVSGDPLFVGLQGQNFKFEGKSGAWYSNLSAKKLQWNLRFKEFDTCPKDENMFVTGTTISLYRLRGLPYMKPELAHSIAIMVPNEDTFFPGCDSGGCLGEGSLTISVDGKMDIVSPGEYLLGENGGRIIAHNTFAACSRKWHDYAISEGNVSEGDYERRLSQKTPLDFLIEDRGQILDPENCHAWILDRAKKNDLFSQRGGWATIHIETPTIKFHVEYRQGTDKCNFHNIDIWISEISPVLLEDEWGGILGETRDPKLYSSEGQMSIISGKDCEDYEVHGAYENKFAAKK